MDEMNTVYLTKSDIITIKERISNDDLSCIIGCINDLCHEYYNRGYSEGYDIGYDIGYDVGRYESYEEEVHYMTKLEIVVLEDMINNNDLSSIIEYIDELCGEHYDVGYDKGYAEGYEEGCNEG